jgi:hypothetical protein
MAHGKVADRAQRGRKCGMLDAEGNYVWDDPLSPRGGTLFHVPASFQGV